MGWHNTAFANVLQHVSVGFILLVYDMYWLHIDNYFVIWLVCSIIFVFWSSHKCLPTLYISFFFIFFLFPVQVDSDDCIKYCSFTSCLYSFTSVEGHGLRVSKNTVAKIHRVRLCENRGHMKVYEPKTEQTAGGCRNLHSLYCSWSIRKTKARISRWVGYVAGIGDQRKRIWNWIGGCEGNRTLRNPVWVDGWIILKCVKKFRTGSFGLYLWCMRGLCCMLFVVHERTGLYVILDMVMKNCEVL